MNVSPIVDYTANNAPNPEADWHNDEYRKTEGGWYGGEPLDSLDLGGLWQDSPLSIATYADLTAGGLNGKRVLCLGNGSSIRELHFLTLGATVTLTDVSKNAMIDVRDRLLPSRLAHEHGDRAFFHVVDASYPLPYEDGSFDLVYGAAFIHHLEPEPMRALLAEIHRVLAPTGRCRFADTAKSDIWQAAKRTVLRPLQMWAHKKHGISPEDVKATARGGYTRPELDALAGSLGFRGVTYQRVELAWYLWHRAKCKIGGRLMVPFYPLMARLDAWLLRHTTIMDDHGIGLLFGLDK